MLISTTFWVAIPPYLTTFSVALLATLVADEDKNDQPYKKNTYFGVFLSKNSTWNYWNTLFACLQVFTNSLFTNHDLLYKKYELTLAKEDNAVSTNSWDWLRGGASLV